VGHTGLPQSKNGCSWILDPRLEQVQLSPYALRKVNSTYTAGGMTPTIEKISAITFRVLNMQASVQFYRNVLGMELLYGGERASFSSLRANDSESAILNLERGEGVSRWGRLIFHVTDVDAFWTHLKERGLILKSHGTRLGGNAISTCSIQMATSCRLLIKELL